MKQNKTPTQYRRPHRYTFGTALASCAIISLILFFADALQAAPANAPLGQTVPLPTATPAVAPLPTATPRSSGDVDSSGFDANSDRDVRDSEGNVQNERGSDPLADADAESLLLPWSGLFAEATVANLNMRSGPGTDFEVTGVINQGERVDVFARNVDGAWWIVCCASDTAARGWTSAQYLTPSIDIAQMFSFLPQVSSLEELDALNRATVEEAAPSSPSSPSSAVLPVSSAAIPTLVLELLVEKYPAYTRPGERVELLFSVANAGNEPARNVQLRNELDPNLTFINFAVSGSGALVQEAGSTSIFNVMWEELMPGDEVTASVTVEVAENLPKGSVVDNIAIALADNAETISGGVSIGMPPSLLPDFK